MSRISYTIIACLVTIITIGSCNTKSVDKNQSEQNYQYSEDRILDISMSQPTEALALLDTIEWKELMEPYQVDFWRSIVYHNGFTNNKRAKMYALKAYNSPDIPKTSEEYYSLTMMLADVCQTEGDYAESVSYCYEGLNIAKQTEDKSLEGRIHIILGVNMMNMYQEKEAFNHFDTAINIFEKLAKDSKDFGAWDDYIYALGTTTDSYNKVKLYDKTIALFPKFEYALTNLKNCDNVPNGLAEMREANTYSLFSNIYRRIGDKQKAKYYYEKLDKLTSDLTPDINLIRIPYLLVDQQYDDALYYIKKGKEYLKEKIDTLSYDYITSYLKNEQKIYEKLGNFKSAYAVQENISSMLDSLRRRERHEDALELAEIYKTNKQAAELEKQRDTIKTRTIISIFSTILLITAVGIIIRVIRYNRTIRRKNDAMIQTIDELMNYKDELLVKQEENIKLKEELNHLVQKSQTTSKENTGESNAEEQFAEENNTVEEEQTASELTEKDRALYDRINYDIQSKYLFLQPEFNKKELMKEYRIPSNKFALLFKEFAGCSFSQYIQNCKINHAVRLMREQPQWTLDAIAKEAQMSNGAFYSQFQKKFGMKPSDYREKILSNKKNTQN